MSEKKKFDKHQGSKYKRFVATMPDGTRLEADTQRELHKKIDVSNLF